jgi:hypothetical protein
LLGLDLLKRGGGHAELILFLHHESLALFVVETEFLTSQRLRPPSRSKALSAMVPDLLVMACSMIGRT